MYYVTNLAPSATPVAVDGFEAVNEDQWPFRMGTTPKFLGLRADSPNSATLDGGWNRLE